MIKAYLNFWKHYADFRGKSTRADYWWVVLVNIILLILFWIVAVLSGAGTVLLKGNFALLGGFLLLVVIAGLYGIAIIIPTLAIGVRRLRDGGFSAWLIIVLLLSGLSGEKNIYLNVIGAVAGIAWFILMLMPSKVKTR